MSRWQEIWRGCRREEQATLLVCFIALALCAGLSYTRSRAAQPLPPLFADAPSTAGTGSTRAVATILVHVSGAVRKPGVFTLPDKARLIDAIRGAGGATASGDINSLNLAARLEDGQQIVVPPRRKIVALSSSATSAKAPSQSSSRASKKEFAGVININQASAADLEMLPGVGPALAGRIIAYRTEHGAFRSISDLDEVKGFGVKKLERLKDHVAF